MTGLDKGLTVKLWLGSSYVQTSRYTCNGQGALLKQRPHMLGSPAGQFYECMNMASLYKLPCIFVVENNKWAIGMYHPRCASARDLSAPCRTPLQLYVQLLSLMLLTGATLLQGEPVCSYQGC